MTSMRSCLLLLLIVCVTTSNGIDLTLTSGSSGTAVVTSCIEQIERTGIFGDDMDILRRFAYAQTNGSDVINGDESGGIWGVPSTSFDSIQSEVFNVTSYYGAVNASFGIDWTEVTYSNLSIPLYSAIAARLLIAFPESVVPLSANPSDQYLLWNFYFHDDSAPLDDQQFAQLIAQIPTTCRSPLRDVMFVIDSSLTIADADFEAVKSFVLEIVSYFDIGSNDTRFAVLQYSNDQQVSLTFEQGSNATTVNDVIMGLTKLDTEPVLTGVAITEASLEFAASGRMTSQGVARVLVLVTQDESVDDVTEPASFATSNQIGIIAIGVGSGVSQSQLSAITSSRADHVTTATDFSSLSSLSNNIQSAVCQEQLMTSVNSSISGVLAPGESLTVSVGVGANGTSLAIAASSGSLGAFYSTSDPAPNAARYDFMMSVESPNEVFFEFVPASNARTGHVTTTLYSTLQCTSVDPVAFVYVIGTEPTEVTTTSPPPVTSVELSEGEIVGIVFAGVILLCGVVIAASYFWFCERKGSPLEEEAKSYPAFVPDTHLSQINPTPPPAEEVPTPRVEPVTTIYPSLEPLQKTASKPPPANANEDAVRQQLRHAIESGDMTSLEAALNDFRTLDLRDKDGDFSSGKRILGIHKSKIALAKAISHRNVHYLQRTIFDTRMKNFQSDLQGELEEAEAVLLELQKIQNLTARLKAAIEVGDLDLVEELTSQLRTMNGCDQSTIDRMLDVYRVKDDLELAMQTRDLKLAIATLNAVEAKGYGPDLEMEVTQAKRMKKELEYLEKVRSDVLNLSQAKVSEIRSYSKPPPGVHEVLMSVYLILGYDSNQLDSWSNIQALMKKSGKESIRRQILEIDPRSIDVTKAQSVKWIIEPFDLHAVKELSLGLSLFYVFVRSMIDEVEKLHTGALNAPSPFKYSGTSPKQRWDKERAQRLLQR